MFHTSSAIVLYITPHTDKTTLVHMYTREFGRVCAAVSGLHGRKSGAKAALFGPLTPLLVTLRGKEGSWRVQEAGMHGSYHTIAMHHGKRSIAFFLAELIAHCVQEHDVDDSLFDFLYASVQTLERASFHPDFHLHFMVQLTQYLGFSPNLEDEGEFFDLQDGVRRALRPNHSHYLLPDQALPFIYLCQSRVGELHLQRAQRQELLENLLSYYRLHIPYFGKLRSLDVLQELFD